MRAPYWHDKTATLYLGDAREVLTEMADGSVDCIVTSPPPWTPHPIETQLSPGYGHQPTPALYIAALRRVFAEAHRVLADTGTAWLAISDQYAPQTRSASSPSGKHRRRATHDQAMTGLPISSLIGLPWQLAFALNDDGWIIRNSIVSHPITEPDPLPEDRFATSHQLIFLLVKQPRYHFDLHALRRPAADPDAAGRRHAVTRHRHPSRRAGQHGNGNGLRAIGNCGDQHGAARSGGRHSAAAGSSGKPPADVWTVPARRQQDTMPIEVPLCCIAAGCRPGGTVLDMFAGTVVTGLAARALGRSFIGVEEIPALCGDAARRLRYDTDTAEGETP